MKKSAGILVYKKDNNIIKVLLCHFGGPYWENADIGGWSIPKGERLKEESIIETAKREFNEETNLELVSSVEYLGSKKVSKRKLAIIFYTKYDFDLSNCKSNTFTIEHPRGSGSIKEYPEMDKFEWLDINTAKKKIIKNQVFFLNKLEEKIGV